MAMTSAQLGNASSNGTFVSQLTGCLQRAVTTVLAEASSTANYVVRRKFAQKAEVQLAPMAQAMATAVAVQVAAVHPSYTDFPNFTDADVDAALAAIYDQVAFAAILPS